MIIKKICPRCKEEKDISLFGIDKHTSTGYAIYCKSCNSIRTKIYHQKNREVMILKMREYRSAHKEEEKARRTAYRKTHKEQRRIHEREYSKNNRHKRNQWQNKYLQTHPEKRIEYNSKRRSLVNNANGNGITGEEWNCLVKSYNFICVYCGNKKPLTIDHIIPLYSGGSNQIENIVPACMSCNCSKRNKSVLFFMYKKRTGANETTTIKE